MLSRVKSLNKLFCDLSYCLIDAITRITDDLEWPLVGQNQA